MKMCAGSILEKTSTYSLVLRLSSTAKKSTRISGNRHRNRMKQSFELKVSQHLTITPQLQQAIRLLQLSTLELKQEVQEALESNPLLEEGDGEHEKTDEAADGETQKETIDGNEDGGELNLETSADGEADGDSDWEDPVDLASAPSASRD